MKVEDYRNDTTARLVKLDERQISIFKQLQRIDRHLEKLNNQVGSHDTDLTMVKTWGAVGVLVMPIIVSIIMRLI
tara:strand:+ start:56 stop:280 length:225 start_codon:yes stop_codon:yes gene_type:complete